MNEPSPHPVTEAHVRLCELRQQARIRERQEAELTKLAGQVRMGEVLLPLLAVVMFMFLAGVGFLVMRERVSLRYLWWIPSFGTLGTVCLVILGSAQRALRRLIEIEAPDLDAKLRGRR